MLPKIEVERISDTRVILTVNGFEIDIHSDETGLGGTVIKLDGDIVQQDFSFDWDEKHINE